MMEYNYLKRAIAFERPTQSQAALRETLINRTNEATTIDLGTDGPW